MDELQRTAGGVVIGDRGSIAMVMSKNSHSWLFPKGHVDEGETDEQAAVREVAEETGLKNLEYIDDLGTYERGEKSIHMFLFAALGHDPIRADRSLSIPVESDAEILDAKWVPFREVPAILGTPHVEWFAKDRVWFASVFDRIQQAIQRD
jgi:8-oxo-dGTP pyrophosphatase MutT (NUDIX family)